MARTQHTLRSLLEVIRDDQEDPNNHRKDSPNPLADTPTNLHRNIQIRLEQQKARRKDQRIVDESFEGLKICPI